MSRLMPGLRSGVTLLEIAVAIAILAVIGAMVYPALSSSRDRNRVLDSIAVLRQLTVILDQYDTLTSSLGTSCGGVSNCNVINGRYPRYLRQLVDSVTTSDGTVCSGTNYESANVTGWRARGPFWNRDFAPGVGFRIPIGLVKDTVIRIPIAPVGFNPDREPGILQFQIDSVRIWDARELKLRVDGYLDDTNVGMVRWSGSANADSIIQPIFWSFPAGGC